MKRLPHELGCGLRLPRSFVLDSTGCNRNCIARNLQPHPAVAVLRLGVMLQYVCSFLYHARPYNDKLCRLDMTAIYILVGATYVPYWGTQLSPDDTFVRLTYIAVATTLGAVSMWTGWLYRFTPLWYAGFAASGFTISFNELQSWLPPVGLAGFWIEVVLYGTQQLIHGLQRPNPLPEFFGYREVQHFILLGATTTHLAVAVAYLH